MVQLLDDPEVAGPVGVPPEREQRAVVGLVRALDEAGREARAVVVDVDLDLPVPEARQCPVGLPHEVLDLDAGERRFDADEFE